MQINHTISGQSIKIYISESGIVMEGFSPHTAFIVEEREIHGATRSLSVIPTQVESTNPHFKGKLIDHSNCTPRSCSDWPRFHP